MGLSEREQRILDEIESGLIAEGAPKVVDPKSIYFILGLLLCLLGLGAMLMGVILKVTILGVGAFLMMLSGVLLAAKNRPQRF
jgi:hypothetical protein